MRSNDFKIKSIALGKTLSAGAGAVMQSRQWRRRVVWALGCLVLLWALADALAPPVAKWQIQKMGSDSHGATLSARRKRWWADYTAPMLS